MNTRRLREVRGAVRTGRSRRRSATSVALSIVLVAAVAALAGCEKVPKFTDLVNPKKKEEPPPAPVAKAPPVVTKPAPAVPAQPAPPKKTAQEVVAEFKATPPERHTDQQLAELANIPDAGDQFTELNLAYSRGISDGGMSYLPKLDRVEKLNIDGCQYSNAALASVAKMKNLTELTMYGGPQKSDNADKGLASLKGMQQLRSLGLQKVIFTLDGLSNVAEMTWLESLSVKETRFADEHLSKLAALVNLKDLDISATGVTDEGFKYLLPFRDLEVLRIASLKGTMHGPGLQFLGKKQAFRNLRKLYLPDNPSLEISGFDGITYFKRTLETLDVGDVGLDNNKFVNGVARCTNLLELFVHRNAELSDAGIQEGLPKLRKLKNLLFSQNPGITDGSLIAVAKLKSLERLTIEQTNCSEQGVRKLKKKLKKCFIVFNGKAIELNES